MILQRSEGGVDSALLYAKTISKYMKDLMSYVEKRTSLGEQERPGFSLLAHHTRCSLTALLIICFLVFSPETEFSKGLQRLYQSCKHSITHVSLLYFTSSPFSLVSCDTEYLKLG